MCCGFVVSRCACFIVLDLCFIVFDFCLIVANLLCALIEVFKRKCMMLN
ncbi:hypothetical protein C548_270 [Candidatus Portiera aleyrodidarum BT-QVLC]|nr:hypothetical protein C548_270 [Candidatus Portiera aleyrodidarum BT-QVLC]